MALTRDRRIAAVKKELLAALKQENKLERAAMKARPAGWKTALNYGYDYIEREEQLLKFVQGLPIVGILGGAANPVYYRRVLRYVQLKYRKRWLWKISNELERGGRKGLVPQ